MKEIVLISTMINQIFLSSLYQSYPSIAGFQELLNSNEIYSSIKRNGKIILENEYIKGYYTLFLNKTRRVSKYNTHTEQQQKCSIQESTGKLNISKLRTASCPNLVHSKDSAVLIGVVHAFYSTKKKIHTVHDSFTVDETDSEFLKKIYFDVFVKHLLESKYDLRRYLLTNNVKLNSEQVKFLNKIDLNRSNLLNKIKNKKLCYSK
jgi:hypothetical protein